ncbi:MAG: OmpA family protein [Candidatus Dadabacteria bacterium]|nr:OmpA family protein [Candidatus Dadabacteria bacterium]
MSSKINKARFISVAFCMVFVVLFAFACGSNVDKEMADAEAALQAARDAGAEGTPEYQAAEELIEKAREMLAAGNKDAARQLLEEARFKAIEAEGKAKNQAYVESVDIESMEETLGSLSPAGSQFGMVDIFFNYNSQNITAESRPVLNQNANIIRNSGGKFQVVVIEGYCDIRGTEEYNLALGQRRADSTKNYLVGLGVSPSKVQAISKGETEQFAFGTSEYDYQQNRRAHFVPAY